MGDMTGTSALALSTLEEMKICRAISTLAPSFGALGLILWVGSASAQGANEVSLQEERLAESSRATGIVQLGTALIALPATEVCPHGEASCQPGESSVAVSLHNLGRIGDFGFGAGITWAAGLRPADTAGAEVQGVSLEREHSRSYFVFEGVFRYYLPGSRRWQWWVGTSLGGVVVSDSWSTLADREPYSDTAFVGPRAITLATEGLAVGLAAGGSWRFANDFIFGARLRYANWLLPSERALSPLEDSASLAGRVDIVDFGLTIGYLLPL